MLEDRDYMRQPVSYRPRLSVTLAILIACVVVFIIECVAWGYPIQFPPNNCFILSLDGLKHGYVWELITYQFMHVGFLHIFLNGWAIFVFGREMEETLGPKKFLVLYLVSGVVGGLVQMLGALLVPSHFGTAVVGASAAALGLVAAFATFYPERELTLLLFFFLPLTLRAKYLLWGAALLSVFCIFFPNVLPTLLTGGAHIANAAHLGGMLTGFIFAWYLMQGEWHWPQWGLPSRPTAPREFVVTRAGRSKFWHSAAGRPDEEQSTDEFVRSEVDPILDKISAHGIQSLTAREREILEKARSKMTKR